MFAKSEHSQVLDRSAPFMEDIVVTKERVTKLLKGLTPSKALGPDELHPRILKELATEFGPVFAHLFQQSIDKGEIPKEWSLANICPLFKKGDRSLASVVCVFVVFNEFSLCDNYPKTLALTSALQSMYLILIFFQHNDSRNP